MSKELDKNSQLFSSNVIFINELYQKFLENPASIDQSWKELFENNPEEVKAVISDYNGPSWSKRKLKVIGSQNYDISTNTAPEAAKTLSSKTSSSDLIQLKALNLINAYKKYGHLSADLDPLNLQPINQVKELSPNFHQISDTELETKINLNGDVKSNSTTVAELISRLKLIYSSKIGAEFDYINDAPEKDWLAQELESETFSEIPKDQAQKILKELVRTEKFEQFLHKRFPGAKRFSIEGGDSSIVALEKIIEQSSSHDVSKIFIGMAHRGRLNTLTGVLGKPYHEIISEFQGARNIPKSATRSGDVKYHMGYSSSREVNGKKVALSLAFNPSHLEAINTVVAGRVRAYQDLQNDVDRSKSLGVTIHGDAAFMGQGSVAESLVINTVEGYNTGGIIHIIINNQIGFTANPWDSRGTRYASDLSKGINAPILHVNGDDPEAVSKVAKIAANYRHKFKKDIVIDLICYRRYGHNEGDEPRYTQPLMYSAINSHKSVLELYSDNLLANGKIDQATLDSIISNFNQLLDSEFKKAEKFTMTKVDWLEGEWKGIKNSEQENVKTAISASDIKSLTAKITSTPESIKVNPKIAKQLELRKKSVNEDLGIDWGNAEALAYASLINENHNIRITGQDSGRGTFSHRHSIIHDPINGNEYNIFSTVNDKAKFEVYDSVLSEYGVLGFEYGYSITAPNSLTIWEAQFGDFANGAQIIFDQFISSAEVKWMRKSGLVMLLPHGYEGQGPEHSSARLERYLQACADNNLRVVNITKPANFFHALRRQILSTDRKPLIVMSPKSLLRHKLATSKISEFTKQNFQKVIAEESEIYDDKKVKKAIICSGKIYYDLFEAREERKIKDIAIIRLEQLYPLPEIELKKELAKYPNAQIIWCQEEPKNMGAWNYILEPLGNILASIKSKTSLPEYVGRLACASPATGYLSTHAEEQKEIIDHALKVQGKRSFLQKTRKIN